jgi:hypothetical protein
MAGSRPTHLLCLQQKEQQTQSPVKIRTDIAYWAHLLITLSILTALLFWAQTLLKPIAFAIIIALLFRPLCSKLERIGLPSTIAILIILISSVALIAAILSLFSAQLYFLFQDLQDFEQNILQIINRLQEIIYRNLPISQKEIDVFIFESRNQILSESSSLLGPTLGASGNFLASAGLTLVYVFFFLLYRKSIFAFILMTQIENKRDKAATSTYWANWWRVYGLGEVGMLEGVIFSNWKTIDTIPDEAKLVGIGLDFGYSVDPTAMIEVYSWNGQRIVNELVYQTGMLNSDIAKKLPKHVPIYADSSEPKSIDEIRRYGITIKGVTKGKDSINYGIDVMQRQEYLVTSQSINLIKELRAYCWDTDKTGTRLNKPAGGQDHGIDALRYHEMETLGINTNYGRYAIR